MAVLATQGQGIPRLLVQVGLSGSQRELARLSLATRVLSREIANKGQLAPAQIADLASQALLRTTGLRAVLTRLKAPSAAFDSRQLSPASLAAMPANARAETERLVS